MSRVMPPALRAALLALAWPRAAVGRRTASDAGPPEASPAALLEAASRQKWSSNSISAAAALGAVVGRLGAEPPHYLRSVGASSGGAPRVPTRLHASTQNWLDSEDSPEREQDELRRMTAFDDYGFFFEVHVPPGWEARLEQLSLRLIHSGDSSEVFKAEIAVDTSVSVALKVADSEDVSLRREWHIRQRIAMMQNAMLMRRSHIVPLWDYEAFRDSTFLLLPAADCSLRELLDMEQLRKKRERGEPVLGTEKTLTLLIDMLRGLRNLEEAGILHNDLTPDNILIQGGRAYITDFSTACLTHDGDRGYGCADLHDMMGDLVGSVYTHAPEMVDGVPTGHANSVWAMGLVLAEMALGYLPAVPPGLEFDQIDAHDRDEAKRREMHAKISDKFAITKAEGFADAPAQLQELLAGMLGKSEHIRWSCTGAIEAALRIAKDLGVEVPAETAMPGTPRAWVGESS